MMMVMMMTMREVVEAWMIYAGLDVFITSPRDPVIDFPKSSAQNSPLLSRGAGTVQQRSQNSPLLS